MSEFKLNEFTKEMARSELANELSKLWGNAERWDVASTGCVANITPIFGYLWLMVAATRHNQEENQNEESDPKYVPKYMYVTKLPSKGGNCGTVDILESGGLSFPTDPQAIAQQCKKDMGVICQPTDDLTPVDKELMRVRGLTNLMTNFPLVYASILSKRIAIGCTRCIIDVKLGPATKLLSPWMDEKLIQLVTNDYFNERDKQRLVIDKRNILEQFKSLLSEVVGGTASEFPDLKEQPWIVQNCAASTLNQLKEVRWLLTNSSMPQCRAIGRQLILIHIDRLISNKDDILTQDNEYKKLYAEVLPDICGASDSDWENLSSQWKNLKKKLPKLESFTVEKYLEDKNAKYSELEKSYGGEDGNDLRFITLGLYPYQLQAITPVTIQKMDAYELDKIFEWLCGENTYDPEVGIWLHKLPGESVESPIKQEENPNKPDNFRRFEMTKQWQEPIISIFYRPSRTPESAVIGKVRQFLCNVALEAYLG